MQMFTACIFILINLQSSDAAVDCPTACSKCRENREYFALLDVYCAMCQECRERRQEWINRVPSGRGGDNQEEINRVPSGRGGDSQEEINRVPSGRTGDSDENCPEDNEDECPTPPPCEPQYESQRITLRSSVRTTTTTTPTPRSQRITLRATFRTTTSKPPCPRVTKCKKSRQKNCCMGCIPICPYPSNCPSEAATQKLAKLDNTDDFFYVHVGVPQDVLNSL